MSFTLHADRYSRRILGLVLGALAYATILASFAVIGLILVGVLGQ